MPEYYAYNYYSSDEDEDYQQFLQEEYEAECMKDYPITWEADNDTCWNFTGHGVSIWTKSQMASQQKPISVIHKRVVSTGTQTYNFPKVITSCSIKKAKTVEKAKKVKKAKID